MNGTCPICGGTLSFKGYEQGYTCDTCEYEIGADGTEKNIDKSYLWDLDINMAAYLAKCLKAFKKANDAHPGVLTMEEWENILDKMIVL